MWVPGAYLYIIIITLFTIYALTTVLDIITQLIPYLFLVGQIKLYSSLT